MIDLIYLCTALYYEAEAFIKSLNLKKDTSITKFQVFKSDKITLIITGTGKVKASIAVTYVLSKMISKEQCNILINIGTCGSADYSIPIGSTFICNKIIDNDTKLSYYPDIIFKHPFKENSIETFSHVVNNKKQCKCTLVDLESSGIYEAASYFFQPHEIFFIKIVSDYLDSSAIDKNKVRIIINNNLDSIVKWTSFLSENYNYNKNILSPKDITLCESVSNNLKFSQYMKDELKNLIVYSKLCNKEIYNTLLNYEDINCTSKKEGKKYLEEIKYKLI